MSNKLKIIVCNAFSLSMLDRETQLGKRYLAVRRIPVPIPLKTALAWIGLCKKGTVELEEKEKLRVLERY